jgi:hypothetical protein
MVQVWAEKNHVWTDCVFKDYLDHFNDEPNEHEACITVLCQGNFMQMVTDGDLEDLQCEFENLIYNAGFWFERRYDSLLFYTSNKKVNQEFLRYFEWQWIKKLVIPDYTSLYEEVYSYFHQNPQKLYALTDRKMEILISEIFRNQGYRSILGPGKNDKGIDVTLYQKDEIDQIVTLVQVKRYKDNLPIKFDAVAALSMIVEEEKANRGLFITTSSYLPQARNFAEKQRGRLVLADSTNVAEWCSRISTRIIRDKSETIQDRYILNILNDSSSEGLIGKVVVAQTGYNTITNQFAIVLKDTPHVSLLMDISGKPVRYIDPPYNHKGYEIPRMDASVLQFKTKDHVFRARKEIDTDGTVNFWGQQKFYTLWDGEPLFYDIDD